MEEKYENKINKLKQEKFDSDENYLHKRADYET